MALSLVSLDFLQALRWGLCLLGAVICFLEKWRFMAPSSERAAGILGDLAVTHFGSQQWPHLGQFFLQGQTTSGGGGEDPEPTPAGRSLKCPVTKLPNGELSLSCDSVSSALFCHPSLLLPCPWDLMVGPQEEVLANFLNADLHSEPSQEALPAIYRSLCCSTHRIL